MKINITQQADTNIFRDKKKYILWFAFFLVCACAGVGVGAISVFFDTQNYKNLEDWALGILVGSSFGITWFGNRLQGYKKLYPPEKEKLVELRTNHTEIERYCVEVESMNRRFIRAEYEAFVDYAEKHSGVPFT